MHKLLTPGTGNQAENRKRAIEYIAKYILDVDSIDLVHGNITTKDGHSYHVSAYAESRAAFVSTPGVEKSKHSIYESGLTSLMYRQIKNDKRAFIYEVNPKLIPVATNSSSASWDDIKRCSTRIWVCDGDKQKLIDSGFSD